MPYDNKRRIVRLSSCQNEKTYSIDFLAKRIIAHHSIQRGDIWETNGKHMEDNNPRSASQASNVETSRR